MSLEATVEALNVSLKGLTGSARERRLAEIAQDNAKLSKTRATKLFWETIAKDSLAEAEKLAEEGK